VWRGVWWGASGRMGWPRRRHGHRDRARFCEACGSSLEDVRSCPRCAALNAAGQACCDSCGAMLSARAPGSPMPDARAYTPRHLAERILTSRAALEGERKHVTVLFADVVESMRLAEGLD